MNLTNVTPIRLQEWFDENDFRYGMEFAKNANRRIGERILANGGTHITGVITIIFTDPADASTIGIRTEWGHIWTSEVNIVGEVEFKNQLKLEVDL
ncbi:MAG: hypothetical protein KUG64_10400 [Cycloclasticus sp.]|nr:hypothetical protein [Cycloclasticus sp.]